MSGLVTAWKDIDIICALPASPSAILVCPSTWGVSKPNLRSSSVCPGWLPLPGKFQFLSPELILLPAVTSQALSQAVIARAGSAPEAVSLAPPHEGKLPFEYPIKKERAQTWQPEPGRLGQEWSIVLGPPEIWACRTSHTPERSSDCSFLKLTVDYCAFPKSKGASIYKCVCLLSSCAWSLPLIYAYRLRHNLYQKERCSCF